MPACSYCNDCPGKIFPQISEHWSVEPKPIMVIGETLSPMEIKKGQRMTGTAVEILKQTMLKVGLPTGSDVVHYTVATACAVPKKKGKQIPKEILLHCRKRLLWEIEQVKPRIILTLGKIPFMALTANFNIKITEEYARPRKYDYCGDATIIPIMHPATIIRAPGDYKPFLSSMYLVASLFKGGDVYDTGETKWMVLRTEEECDKAIKFLHNFERVNADMETTSLDYREAEFLVMGICFAKNKVLIIPREMRHRVKDFFAIPVRWTWHHGKYDKKVMWRRGIADLPLHNDTIYMHYVLDETSAHDLEFLTKTFLQAEPYKYKMNQNWKNVTLSTYPQYFDALCERVAVDCDYGYQLETKLLEELSKPENAGLKQLYEKLIMPAANFLSRVEQNGILTDEDYLNHMNVLYDEKLAHILSEIQEEADKYWDPELYKQETGAKTASERFNPGSPQQMAWMVFDRLKLKPRIKKGRSTDKDVLNSIEDDIPLIKKVLEYRKVAKEKATYIEGNLKYRDIDGRVRTTFSLHVTATGRLSSKEPNVQNISDANSVGNIRRAFIPAEGYILAEIDYSGAELRWLAFLSGCPVLKEVFIQGRNLHHETAVALYGEHYTKAQKLRAKAVNFGIPYGRDYASFMDEFNISKEEAIDMIKGWLDKYHGARDYLQWCADQVVAGKYLETVWHRRRRFGLVTKENLRTLQNEAKNFPIQSSSSDLLLWSAMQAEPLCAQLGVRILNLIHDSVLLEIPANKDTVMKATKLVSDLMIEAPIKLFNCDVPFKTDIEIGADWGNLKTFNCDNGTVNIGDEDDEQWVDFDRWLKEYYHWDIYKSDWYKNLGSVPRTSGVGLY